VYLHLRVNKSCLIWTSLCMLFEVVTIDLHYMNFEKYQKYCGNKDTYILDALEVS